MLKKEVKYSYDDISVVPAEVSEINHRSECNPYTEEGNLPLFTAPMDSVVSIENFNLWEENKINAILPRTVDVNTRLDWVVNKEVWVAFSLQEFNKFFIEESIVPKGKILVDIANGHMESLYKSVEDAKIINPDLIVMVGNVANPETYRRATKSGVDYIRVGVGSGKGCFVEGTRISLTNGKIKPIENIEEGDEVITHLGKGGIVTSLKCYDTDNLITINGEISCTPNHKFLVINTNDLEKITDENLMEYAYWVCASQLDINLHTLVKFNNETNM